jgi:hypothetical protein
MSFKGIQLLPFLQTAAAQLERHRFLKLTKATGAVAYATYGEEADGISRDRGGDAGDYPIGLQPIDLINESFFIRMAGTVTKGCNIVTTVNGQGKTADYTVVNDDEYSAPSTANPSTYLVPADGWGSAHANNIAVYTGSWAYTAPTAGTVVYVTSKACYKIYNGSAWVEAPVMCQTREAGSSGEDVACFITKTQSQVERLQVKEGQRNALRIVDGGLFTMTATAATHVINHPEIASGDVAFAALASAANDVYVKKVAVAANAITVTLSGSAGSSGSIQWIDCRAAA